MSSTFVLRSVFVFALLLTAGLSVRADLYNVERKLWAPVADEVYLQEDGQQVATSAPVVSLALHEGVLYAVVDGKVHVLKDDKLETAANAPSDVHKLATAGGSLWALAKKGIHRFAGQDWQRIDERPYVDLCVHLGVVHAATREDVYRFENGTFVCIKPADGYKSSDSTMLMEDGTQLLADPVEFGPLDRIVSHSGTIYALSRGGLVVLDGEIVRPDPIDWGTLPSRTTRDILSVGSCLYVTTDRGVAVLRGMAMTVLRGQDGLPYEDTTCLAEGFANDLWVGTTTGAIRKIGNEFQYFGAKHWLPADNVHAIAAAERTVYIATDGGIGIIRYEPYTLLKKASNFERHIEEWGHKRLGFNHSIHWGGDEMGWLREISDNDGGHTAHYLAAMSFKYAVTGDEKARENAVDAFQAMIWLEQISPVRGFFARAIWSVKGDKGQRSDRGSGGLPADWYPTDDGLWLWKGDTSSDEVDGHFYAVSIFRELVAKGPEKKRAEEHLARIAAHIVDNGWVLRDMDGKPTRWGRWDPAYLQRPYGFDARGLNGMQAQMYVQTAYAMTGDPKFEAGLRQLLDWGYQNNTVRQKLTFPPDLVVPWDDELGFRTYYTLLRYATDPGLRSIYLRSIDRSWEVKRIEHVPWFNFIYGATTGNDCEVDRAVKYLREFPLDLRNWRYRNSHRDDLAPEPGYVPYQGGTRGMSPRETQAMSGSKWALGYDGGGAGTSVTDPSGWLEDYWMGRYHGFVSAPSVTDPELLSVPSRPGMHLGAAPYDGPPRPTGLIPAE